MVEAVVEFEYKALEGDELSLAVGDVVKEVVKHDGGWWQGTLNGNRGLFPENFVREINKEKPDERPAPSTRKASGGSGGGHVAELANKLHKDGGIRMGPPVKQKKEAPQKKVTARVTYNYNPETDDELKLQEGDVVEVLKQDDGGWWSGSLNGQLGMFPSNFVELVPSDQIEEEPAEIRGQKVRGFGMGDIFSGGPIKLRKADAKKEVTQGQKQSPPDQKPTRPVPQPAGASAPGSARPTPHKDNKTERARVVFTYGAEAPDELSLQDGEVITILDKNLSDKGWWKGEANGKQGIFPENFVELISSEPISKPRKPPPPPSSPLTKDRAELPPPPGPKQPPKKKKVPTATLR